MQGNHTYNNANMHIKNIATNSANFLLNNPQASMNPIDLYNEWSRKNDLSINNAELSDWILEFMATMKSVNKNLLEEAVRLDTDKQSS